MTRIHLWIMALGVVTIAIPVKAEEDGFPEKPSYDWPCVLPYTDSTCAEMMSAWAADNEIDLSNFPDRVACSDCEPQFETYVDGNKALVGYKCKQRDGHTVKTEDLNTKLERHRQGSPGFGWEATSWKFNYCVTIWTCSEQCSLETLTPDCIPSGVYGIGRWTPTRGDRCEELTEEDYRSSSSDAPSGNSNTSGSGSGSYGSGSSSSGAYGSGGSGVGSGGTNYVK